MTIIIWITLINSNKWSKINEIQIVIVSFIIFLTIAPMNLTSRDLDIPRSFFFSPVYPLSCEFFTLRLVITVRTLVLCIVCFSNRVRLFIIVILYVRQRYLKIYSTYKSKGDSYRLTERKKSVWCAAGRLGRQITGNAYSLLNSNDNGRLGLDSNFHANTNLHE